MKQGKVWMGIKAILKRRPAHFGLIDPEKQGSEGAGELAASFFKAGSDAVMVGGSTGINSKITDATVIEIKKRCSLPTILFPAGAACLSKYADALFFMSLLNSRDRRFFIEEQRKAAPIIKKLHLEPIAMGYIVFEPGMRVGEVGKAELVDRADLQRAVGYAITAELFGMSCVYLEAGSGAPEPLPAKTIRAVKRSVGIPVIVGGGITSPEAARTIVRAGADIVVTGTVAEFSKGREELLAGIVSSVRKG